MKILVVSSLWPHGEHSIRAANIVIYEMILALSKQTDVRVGLLVVGKSTEVELKESELRSSHTLKSAGVHVLEPLVLSAVESKRSRMARMINPKIVDWYPACQAAELIAQRVASWGADVVLVPWSEWLTHACSDLQVLKFAYYGNPDPKASRTQLRLKQKGGEISWMRKIIENAMINRFEQIHLQVMRRYELLGDVAKNDAEYYSSNGHKNAFYIQNMWMKPAQKSISKTRQIGKPIKIIGSIGKLSGTANTLGLEYLGREVLPELDSLLNGRPYEIHIIGFGMPNKISAEALSHPCVVWRGFVDNIDEEILDCDVFLCVNNATEYKVAHTRYLHAWSLSAPVVAHQDVALSIPEIRDNVNALLGANAAEIARNIIRLVDDVDLNERIRKKGFETFNAKFTAQRVAQTINLKINEYLAATNTKIIN